MKDFLYVIAAVTVIAVGAVWLNKNVSYGCIDLGFMKHCGATVAR